MRYQLRKNNCLFPINFHNTFSTGLPTKDVISDTTVQNLDCLFSYIYNCKLVSIFPNHGTSHKKTISKAEDLINLGIVKYKEI